MKIRRIVSTALCLVALCATRPALSGMSEDMAARRARYESMTPKERHAYEHQIVRGKLDAMTGRRKSMPADLGMDMDAHVRAYKMMLEEQGLSDSDAHVRAYEQWLENQRDLGDKDAHVRAYEQWIEDQRIENQRDLGDKDAHVRAYNEWLQQAPIKIKEDVRKNLQEYMNALPVSEDEDEWTQDAATPKAMPGYGVMTKKDGTLASMDAILADYSATKKKKDQQKLLPSLREVYASLRSLVGAEQAKVELNTLLAKHKIDKLPDIESPQLAIESFQDCVAYIDRRLTSGAALELEAQLKEMRKSETVASAKTKIDMITNEDIREYIAAVLNSAATPDDKKLDALKAIQDAALTRAVAGDGGA